MTDRPAFLKLKIKNRSVLASGILGVTISSLRKVHSRGAAIVTTKSIGPEKRKGHPAPVVYDWGGGIINAVGLSNPGIDGFVSRWKQALIDFPVIVSIFGKTVKDFMIIAEKLEPLNYDFLELNISCPNVSDEFGTPFSFSDKLTQDITRRAKTVTSRPVIVKLSPGIPDMVRIAVASQESGADAVCIANTAGPGMVIDTNTAVPVLANKTGGISGPAVLPLTVKNIFAAYKELSIPIIGTGGISGTNGALQVLMAGASLYGIGSAVYSEGLGIFKEIGKGVLAFARENGFESTQELIGLAHKTTKLRYYRIPGFVKSHAQGTRYKKFQVVPVKGFSLMKRGKFSEAVFGLTEGEPVGLLGPLGNGFDLERFNSYLLAGGGIGTAPLIYTAARLAKAGKKAHFIAGGKSRSSLEWIPPLLDKLKIGSDIELLYCTEDGSFGEPGVVTEHFQKVIKKACPEYALVCGPEIFIKNSIAIFKKGRLQGQASIERMMKCGIGICGSCCVDGTGDRVCVEGPVFQFDYIDRLTEFGNYKRDESGSVQRLD